MRTPYDTAAAAGAATGEFRIRPAERER